MAIILNCRKLTIPRLIQRYRVTADRPQSGRPRVTTANEDRHLRILHLRSRFLTVTSSAATDLGRVIRCHTVHRRLRQHGIGAYRPFRGMTLTRQHRLRRLRWACEFQRWHYRNWQHALFSDEQDSDIATSRRENSSMQCPGDCIVWWWICDGLERYMWPTADSP